jgi:hypothetical protein
MAVQQQIKTLSGIVQTVPVLKPFNPKLLELKGGDKGLMMHHPEVKKHLNGSIQGSIKPS